MAKKQIPSPAPSSESSSSARSPIRENQKEQQERALSPKSPSTARSARAAKPAKQPEGAAAAISKPATTNGKIKSVVGKTRGSRSTSKGEIDREAIALRAYFISERRRAHGECREPSEDWLEAERELTAEIRGPSKTKG